MNLLGFAGFGGVWIGLAGIGHEAALGLGWGRGRGLFSGGGSNEKSKAGSCAAQRARMAAKLWGFARVRSLKGKHRAPARGGACARFAGCGLR